MEMAAQIFASGLVSGCVIALAALGFTLVYSATGIANFAAGEFVMMGGVLMSVMMASAGLPPVLAVPAAIAAVALLGAAMDRMALQPARRRAHVTLIVITIGVGIVFRGLTMLFAGKGVFFPDGLGGLPEISLMGAHISSQGVWIVLTLAVVSFALWVLLERTWLGRAMRATSENARAATLMGISPKRISILTFGLAGALGAIGGTLSAPLSSMSYESGLYFGLKGFAAAILGGLGTPVGAVAGGLIIGFVEAITAGYISSAYKDLVALLILILVLSFKPTGLFGKKLSKRV